jgi:hypothetical protein
VDILVLGTPHINLSEAYMIDFHQSVRQFEVLQSFQDALEYHITKYIFGLTTSSGTIYSYKWFSNGQKFEILTNDENGYLSAYSELPSELEFIFGLHMDIQKIITKMNIIIGNLNDKVIGLKLVKLKDDFIINTARVDNIFNTGSCLKFLINVSTGSFYCTFEQLISEWEFVW